MTQDEIIRMAREAGYQHPDAVGTCEDFAYFDLERFAAIVAQNYMAKACGGCVIKQAYKRMDAEIEAAVLAEREACALMVDKLYHGSYMRSIRDCAAAIRARGENGTA